MTPGVPPGNGHATGLGVLRTVQRGYAASTGRRSARVTRVHVIRDVGPKGWEGGAQAWCGVHGWDVTDSPAIVRDTPHALPEGLEWCGKCIGQAAEYLGRIEEVARLLGISKADDQC